MLDTKTGPYEASMKILVCYYKDILQYSAKKLITNSIHGLKYTISSNLILCFPKRKK